MIQLINVMLLSSPLKQFFDEIVK